MGEFRVHRNGEMRERERKKGEREREIKKKVGKSSISFSKVSWVDQVGRNVTVNWLSRYLRWVLTRRDYQIDRKRGREGEEEKWQKNVSEEESTFCSFIGNFFSLRFPFPHLFCWWNNSRDFIFYPAVVYIITLSLHLSLSLSFSLSHSLSSYLSLSLSRKTAPLWPSSVVCKILPPFLLPNISVSISWHWGTFPFHSNTPIGKLIQFFQIQEKEMKPG